MYAQYDGLIFDMDGTLLGYRTHASSGPDRSPGPLRYALRFTGDDCPQRIAHRRIAQAVIELNQADLDPHQLAREKPTR